MALPKLSKVSTPVSACQGEALTGVMSRRSAGLRGVPLEHVGETRRGCLDLLLRHRAELVVRGTDDLAFGLRRTPVGHGEQRVGDARRVFPQVGAGGTLLRRCLLIERV